MVDTNSTVVIDAQRSETHGARSAGSLGQITVVGFQTYNPNACALLGCMLRNQRELSVTVSDGDPCWQAWDVLAACARDGCIGHLDARTAGSIASGAIAEVVRGNWEDHRADVPNTNRIHSLSVEPVGAAVDALRSALAERNAEGEPPLEHVWLEIDPLSAHGWVDLVRSVHADTLELKISRLPTNPDTVEMNESSDAVVSRGVKTLVVSGPGAPAFLMYTICRSEHPSPNVVWHLGVNVLDSINDRSGGSDIELVRYVYIHMWPLAVGLPYERQITISVTLDADEVTADRVRTLRAVLTVINAGVRSAQHRSTRYIFFVPAGLIENDRLRIDRIEGVDVWIESDAAKIVLYTDPTGSFSLSSVVRQLWTVHDPIRHLHLIGPETPIDRDPNHWVEGLTKILDASDLEHLRIKGCMSPSTWALIANHAHRSVRSLRVSTGVAQTEGFETNIGRFERLDSIRIDNASGRIVHALRAAMVARHTRALRYIRIVGGPDRWDGFFDDTPVIARVDLHPSNVDESSFRMGRLRCNRLLSLDGPNGIRFACRAVRDSDAPRIPRLRIRVYGDRSPVWDGTTDPAGMPDLLESYFRGCERIPDLAHTVFIDVILPWNTAHREAFRVAFVNIANRIEDAAASMHSAFRVRFEPEECPGDETTGHSFVTSDFVNTVRKFSDAVRGDGARFSFTVNERFMADESRWIHPVS